MINLFSVPADFKYATIDILDRLNAKYPKAKIIETYGQITVGHSVLNSGREIAEINQVDFEYLAEYVTYSKSKNIDFSYTLNATTLGNMELTKKGIEEIFLLLEKLSGAGVKSITVTLPTVMEIVKYSGFDLKIKVSILASVDTPAKALHYKKLGAERIVANGDILRNFDKLKKISAAFGDGIELIVNDTCLMDCPYKMAHFNYAAFTVEKDPELITSFFINRCHKQKVENLSNYMMLNWIRPEDLFYYNNVGIHYFKIQGRQFVQRGDPAKVIEAYMKESYSGDLHDLLNLFVKYNSFSPVIDNKKMNGFIKPFAENPNFCDKNCSTCHYCEEWAKKCIDFSRAVPLADAALNYFNDADQFIDMIGQVREEHSKGAEEFDF